MVFITQEDKTLADTTFPYAIDEVFHFVDVKRDGTQLVAVPHKHDDSLFVAFLDKEATVKNTVFLASGQPHDGMPWDPVVRDFWIDDVDHDRHDELISIINTGHALSPRGLLMHT